MNRIALAIIVLPLLAAMGCGQRGASAAPEAGDAGKLNAGAPSSVLQSETGAVTVDPEAPKAGMNNSRPDSSKDVKPTP